MNGFENSTAVLEFKASLRELFESILATCSETLRSFYEWLKTVPIPAPPTVLRLFSNNRANLILFLALVVYFLYFNIKAYVLFAEDKHYAIRKTERIPEKVLFKYMWAGGAVGAAIAMIIKHHKTQHMNFVVSAVALVAVQLLLFSFALGFMGFWAFF